MGSLHVLVDQFVQPIGCRGHVDRAGEPLLLQLADADMSFICAQMSCKILGAIGLLGEIDDQLFVNLDEPWRPKDQSSCFIGTVTDHGATPVEDRRNLIRVMQVITWSIRTEVPSTPKASLIRGSVSLSISRIRGFPPMPGLASRSWDHWSPPSSPGPHPLLGRRSQAVDSACHNRTVCSTVVTWRFGDVG
jgi:hypothetical protein